MFSATVIKMHIITVPILLKSSGAVDQWIRLVTNVCKHPEITKVSDFVKLLHEIGYQT